MFSHIIQLRLTHVPNVVMQLVRTGLRGRGERAEDDLARGQKEDLELLLLKIESPSCRSGSYGQKRGAEMVESLAGLAAQSDPKRFSIGQRSEFGRKNKRNIKMGSVTSKITWQKE